MCASRLIAMRRFLSSPLARPRMGLQPGVPAVRFLATNQRRRAGRHTGQPKSQGISQLVGKMALAGISLMLLASAVWLSPPHLPVVAQRAGFSTSSLSSNDDVTFRGAGWGHGVGISHQALPARVAAGQTAADILNFYYPGTVLDGGWGLDNLRVLLAVSSSSRFRPRGPFDLVVDGTTVYSSSETALFRVTRSGNGWDVTTSDGFSLCPGLICSGDVLQIRTADGVAVESSATRNSYSHGQITLSKMSGNSWYRIVLTDLNLELYLRGVAEVPGDWPTEALRAQAIASRSYALHVARENRSSDTWTAPFDIYSTTMSQVYSGNSRELSPRNGPWLQAIADTTGQVLAFNGEPALTLFTTSGGGYTENSGYVFNEQHPYLVANADPYVSGDPYSSWTRSYSVGALSRWLARMPDTNVGSLQRIEVSGNIGVSGRIDRATVSLSGSAGNRSVTGSRFVFVVNKGAESEGWGPMPNAQGRGGHLLSTLFTFGDGTTLPTHTTLPADLTPNVAANQIPSQTASIDPPGEPLAVSLVPGPSEITVTWQPPAYEGGAAVTGYVITWVSSTGASGTIPTSQTSRTLRNLSNQATYTISVAATNAGGTSSAVTVTAKPLGAPSPPTDVNLRSGDGLLEISWSAADGGGLAVASYSVHWTGPDGVTKVAKVQGTQHTIGDLTNGANYTVTVIATNEAGSSAPSTPASSRPAAPPDRPEAVRASRGDGLVEVSWTAPGRSGGLPITGYLIAWTSSTGASGTIQTSDTSYTMQNLLNGASYTIEVSATNEAGTSPAGEAVTATPAAAPAAPAQVTVDRGDRRVDITWQPPASDGGKPVQSYTVSWTAPDGTGDSAETTATSHTFEGLTNGVSYSVVVTATNEIGTSAASQPASGTPAFIPGAPVAIRVARDDARLHVSWDPPASDGGLQVTSYTVLWVAPDGTTDSADTSGTSYTIEGLTNGSTYGITVSATNEVGSSVTADPVRATPAGVPGSPARAEIAIGHESLLVSWEPPTDDGGLPVHSYTLTWSAPDGQVTSIETTHTSHTIADLVGGAEYEITILAHNDVGASPAALSAQATPDHAVADDGDDSVGSLATSDSESLTVTATEPPGISETTLVETTAAAPAAPAAAPQAAPTNNRSWQDAVTNDTAIVVLAAVGLVLIAALLAVTRRRQETVEEANTDLAEGW